MSGAKPFVEMDAGELRDAFDKIGSSVSASILDDARKSKQPILLAVVVLTLVTGERRVVTYNPEYGDEDGLGYAVDFVKSTLRSGLLKRGESLEVVVCQSNLEDFCIVTEPVKRLDV